MSPWTPPGHDPIEHAALVPGIPAWIDAPIRGWVVERITNSGSGVISDSFLTAWDVSMRNDPPHIDRYAMTRGGAFWNALDSSEKLALLDFLIFLDRDKYNAEDGRKSLEMYLRAGGSEWRVGMRGGEPGLEKRVPQGVADAAEAVMATSATAGALLSEAWHNAYGRSPDPEEAYEKAIKAVEEAGAEVVLPKNSNATLGTMIATVRDQGDWHLPLESPSASSAPLEMMKALWEGQESRHGGNGYRKPTPAEAEAAVLLAVPLVQFFIGKLLSRRTL
jgi:hypothetical protein